MLKWVRLLLLVALPALAMTPAIAGDYDNDLFVEARVFNIEAVVGTDRVIVSIALHPNDLQMCVCTVMTPSIRCICETPPMGMCIERES